MDYLVIVLVCHQRCSVAFRVDAGNFSTHQGVNPVSSLRTLPSPSGLLPFVSPSVCPPPSPTPLPPRVFASTYKIFNHCVCACVSQPVVFSCKAGFPSLLLLPLRGGILHHVSEVLRELSRKIKHTGPHGCPPPLNSFNTSLNFTSSLLPSLPPLLVFPFLLAP